MRINMVKSLLNGDIRSLRTNRPGGAGALKGNGRV